MGHPGSVPCECTDIETTDLRSKSRLNEAGKKLVLFLPYAAVSNIFMDLGRWLFVVKLLDH